MGGTPVLAINLLCWPTDVLPMELATEVEGAGKERSADVAAFEEVPIWIPLLDFQAEGNAEKTEGNSGLPSWSHPAEPQLCPRQSHRHALDRVGGHFDHAAKGVAVGLDEEVGPANEEALGIEWLTTGG